jgi:hypothetical protein
VVKIASEFVEVYLVSVIFAPVVLCGAQAVLTTCSFAAVERLWSTAHTTIKQHRNRLAPSTSDKLISLFYYNSIYRAILCFDQFSLKLDISSPGCRSVIGHTCSRLHGTCTRAHPITFYELPSADAGDNAQDYS